MSILDQAVHGKVARPRKILVYGEHFSGKTTWAARFPAAIIMSVEDGTADIDCTRLPATLFNSAGDLLGAVKEVSQCDEYGTIVIDSLDWFERQIDSELVASGFECGYGMGPKEVARRFKILLDLLDKCIENGQTVIMIAHQEIRTATDTSGNSWDQIQPKLSKRVTEMVLEYADEALLAMREDRKREEKGAFGKKTTVATTTGRRVFKTDSHPAYIAGCRLELPPTIDMNSSITPFLMSETNDE